MQGRTDLVEPTDRVDSATIRALGQLAAVLREIAVAQTSEEEEITGARSPEQQQRPKREVQSNHREKAI